MPTTIHNTGITFPDATTQTTAASGGGQLQVELFTAPGTWTKPASCTQVKVTVIGGGGGGQAPGTPQAGSGGTSSFGPFITCTGGTGGNNNPGNNFMASPGSALVYAGTTIRSGAVLQSPTGYNPSSNIFASYYTNDGIQGAFFHQANKPSPQFAGQPYTTSLGLMAGQGGGSGPANAYGGSGGLAVVSGIPVTGPVSITIGSGGNASHPSVTAGAIGGAILVEYIG
jgi:hypothetical protein